MTEAIANQYRRKAEECRARAGTATRNEDKAAWLEMAKDWQLLAEGVHPKAPGSGREKNQPDQAGA